MTTTMRTSVALGAALLVALLVSLFAAIGGSAQAYEAPRPGRPAPQAQLWCTRDVPCPGDGGGSGYCVKGGGYPPKCY